MAETYFFIQLQNAEPFMMSIDKEVNYQTFDEEIKKRFSKSTEDNLLYTFLSANGESTIQNDEDLSNALTFAESLGDDFLFVINVTEKPKTVENVGEKELEELEELEKLVPEEQKDSSFSIPISGQKEEPVKEEKKDSERKDDGIDLLEFLKNQISEQLPALSPILGSLNFENLINNINNVNNNNNEEKDVLEEIPNIIKQFLPVVLDNLQSVPKVSIPCPPPPPPPAPYHMRFPQAFSCPPPPPAPHVRACLQNPFMQSFACPNIRSMPAFVPPSSQPQNPLHSLFEMLLTSNATQTQQQKQQDKPKSPVYHMAVCDHCSKQIIGIRYKCLNCPNFDLCERCEVYSPQCHNPDHVFAKIRTTNQFVAPRVPVPPQCRRPVNQPPRPVHPHFCAKPPVKLNIIRPHPPPTVQFPPQVRPHPVPPYMRSCPKPVPENDKIKTLEEQIASLESSIASIKSSLASQKEKPRPQPTRRSIFNYSFREESDDSDESDGSDDSEGEDQVFEVKVNKRW